MTPRHPLAVLTLAALLVVSLAGCAENGPADADPATADGASTPAVDYPDEGVDLVDRPEAEGVYEQALQTYVDFERGRRQAAREGRVGRLLSFNATASVVDPYRAALAAYADGGTYDGDVAIEFTGLRPRDLVLTIEVCVDATALEVPEGAPTLLGEATRAPQRIQVSNLVGPWRVTKVQPLDGSC